jgi:hypothetical protein
MSGRVSAGLASARRALIGDAARVRYSGHAEVQCPGEPKKHWVMIAMHHVHYNLARIHKPLRVTPAMEA